jgi:hypothetical protein
VFYQIPQHGKGFVGQTNRILATPQSLVAEVHPKGFEPQDMGV